jgi:cytosolic carboxypeptidase protein 5
MCDDKNPSDLKLVYGEFDKDIVTSSTIYEPAPATDPYDVLAFQDLGVGILQSLLDYNRINPYSRLPNTRFKNLDNLKLHLANNLMKILPHRLDSYIRKMNRVILSENSI